MTDKYYEFKVPVYYLDEEDIPPIVYSKLLGIFRDAGLRMRIVGNVSPNDVPFDFYVLYGEDNPKQHEKAMKLHIPFEVSDFIDKDGNVITDYQAAYQNDKSNIYRRYSVRVITSNGTFVFANPTVFADSNNDVSVFTVYDPEFLGQFRPYEEYRNSKVQGTSKIEYPITYYVLEGGPYDSIDDSGHIQLDGNFVTDDGVSGGIAVPIIDHLIKNGKHYALPNPNVFQVQLQVPTTHTVTYSGGTTTFTANDTLLPPGTKFYINGQKFMYLGTRDVDARMYAGANALALRLV